MLLLLLLLLPNHTRFEGEREMDVHEEKERRERILCIYARRQPFSQPTREQKSNRFNIP